MLLRVEKYSGNSDNDGDSDFLEVLGGWGGGGCGFLAVAGLYWVEYRITRESAPLCRP